MFTDRTKKMLAAISIGVLIAAIGVGTWALVARGQSPALPTNPDGSIIIPADMIQAFEKVAGEPLNKLNEDFRALSIRSKSLENFYVQLRMNTLAAANIPANQYDWWRLDTEKKALVKLTQAQYDQVKKQKEGQ